jgi:hypothetical protein
MKYTLPLLLLPAILAFASCKSNDNQNPTPTNLLSGYLAVSRQLDLDSPATKYTEQAWAAFFMHPYEFPSDSMHILVDSVRINTTNATLDNAPKLYRASGALLANTNCNWQVWSSSNIASFSYNFTTPYPSYTYKMPDTIDRSKDFSIQMPSGSDSSSVTLSANVSLFSNNGSFSMTDLGTLDAGPATLEVIGNKRTVQAFGGKNFRFSKQTVKTKPVWLK